MRRALWPWRVVAPLTPLAPVKRCGAENDATSYRGDHETWISARFTHRWPQ